MQRGSDKHGARRDDAMAAEVQGLEKGEKQTHAEAWKEAEPSGEDQPDVDYVPDTTLTGGTPTGMSSADVDGRSELASYLGGVYPADRDKLVRVAEGNNATDDVLAQLRRLPADRQFGNVDDVWSALGGGTEEHRF